MEEKEIIDLFWDRKESAVKAAEEKYHDYCHYIVNAILGDAQDAEECVNDVWLKAWNCIPPNRPENLTSFLGKLARTTAIDCIRKRNRKCRGGTEQRLVLEELEESIPNKFNVEKEVEGRELSVQINKFLGTISRFDRNVFVCRYWYMDSIQTIAQNAGASESKIKSVLFRTRKKLKVYLGKAGYYVE